MSIINTTAKEIHCKIVYYGPKNAGKKSALLYIKDHFDESRRSFFKLPLQPEIFGLCLNIGKVFSFQTFFHIYNLSNENYKENQVLLNGADGILFLASLDPKDSQKNKDSFSEMERFLKENGEDVFKIPLVLQYNKSDLKEKLSLKSLRKALNKYNSRDFESSIFKKDQVMEPLKQLCKLVLIRLK